MGSKGANKSFDYNLIKILDAVILSGNAAMAAKKLVITRRNCLAEGKAGSSPQLRLSTFTKISVR